MKKTTAFYLAALAAAFLAGCAPGLTGGALEGRQTGAASVTVHFIDYAALTGDAGKRAIAPQTGFARLSRLGTEDWIEIQQLPVTDDDLTDLTDADTSAVLPVSRTGTVVFSGIPAGTYAKGTLKIDLTETASGSVLSSGTNDTEVVIEKDTVSDAVKFYTVPQDASDIASASISGAVEAGKMAFYKVECTGGTDFWLSVLKTGGSGEPDVFLFNFTGYLSSYGDYPDSGALEIPLEAPSDVDTQIYAGVFADGGDVEFEITHSTTIPSDTSPGTRGEGSPEDPLELVLGTPKSVTIVYDDENYDTDDYSYYKFSVTEAGKYVLSASNFGGSSAPYAWVNLYSGADFSTGYISLSSGSAFSSSVSRLTAQLAAPGTYYLMINQSDTAENLTFDLLVEKAPPEWLQSVSITTPNKVSSMELDGNGSPVVLYTETDTSDWETRLSVKRETSAGWVQVGSQLFSNAVNSSCGLSVHTHGDDKIAVAYGGGASSLQKNLQVFEFDGTAWIQLGGDIVGMVESFDVKVQYGADGTLYLFYASKAYSKEIYVRKWDAGTSSWVKAGNEVEDYAARNQYGSYYDSYIWGLNGTGSPELILSDYSGIIVRTLSGGTWSDSARPAVPSGSILSSLDGTLYSLQQATDSGAPAEVMVNVDGDWNPLGDPVAGVSRYSHKALSKGADGELYFAYMDSALYRLVFRKWDAAASEWKVVDAEGTPAIDSYFTLSVNAQGKVYLGFFPSGVVADYKVYSYTPAD